MADNVSLTGVVVATDKVTYSGDTVDVQLNEVVHVAGSEGSRTVTKMTDATGLNVHDQPTTTGFMLRHHFVAAGTANAANVKSSAGQIFSIHIFNNSQDGLPVKLDLYDTAGTPTAGTSVVESYACSAGQSREIQFPKGNPFATGIGRTLTKVAVATDMADTSSTVCVVNDAIVDIKYI